MTPAMRKAWPGRSSLLPVTRSILGRSTGVTARHAMQAAGISRNASRQWELARLPPTKVSTTVPAITTAVNTPMAPAIRSLGTTAAM